jgi:LmbE family N-acetylglucosaminyl deacetylase
LGTVRLAELTRAARLYHASLEAYDLYNAPMSSKPSPTRAAVEATWRSQGDPAGLVARAIRRFRPDVVVTLDPYGGFTGHPEHEAAAIFALEGARIASDAAADNRLVVGEPPHRIERVYQVQNRYWFTRLAGRRYDPKPYDFALEVDRPCEERDARLRTCVGVQHDATRVHASQYGEMSAVRKTSAFWHTVYIRELDPWDAEVTALVREVERGGG